MSESKRLNIGIRACLDDSSWVSSTEKAILSALSFSNSVLKQSFSAGPSCEEHSKLFKVLGFSVSQLEVLKYWIWKELTSLCICVLPTTAMHQLNSTACTWWWQESSMHLQRRKILGGFRKGLLGCCFCRKFSFLLHFWEYIFAYLF